VGRKTTTQSINAVQLMSTLVLAGCIQMMQIIATDNRGQFRLEELLCVCWIDVMNAFPCRCKPPKNEAALLDEKKQ